MFVGTPICKFERFVRVMDIAISRLHIRRNHRSTNTAPGILHALSDETSLIDACRRGHPGAWDALIQRYEKPLYKFAFALARNHDDASDIAGQVLVRLFENIHTFRNESNFTSWVFRIARNVYVDTCIRAPHRSHVSLDEGIEVEGNTLLHQVADDGPGPEQRFLDQEKRNLLNKAIRHLPSYQRRMVEMFHEEGRSYEEIARETGLSLGTVKSRLSRARHMLRERLAYFEDALMTA
jgi:RNA polymerase sigma-70 factor (ECF subfamily)